MHLFTDTDEWTKEAAELDREFQAAVAPIMAKWARLGFSPREISYVGQQVIQDSHLNALLGWVADNEGPTNPKPIQIGYS